MYILGLQEKYVTQFDIGNRRKIKTFLEKQNLTFDEDIQYSIVILDEEEIIGTGSFDNDVIKCVAVAPNYKGYGLTNKIVTELITEQHRRGFEHIFVYTKPENEKIFGDLGFYKIIEIPNKVILLENKKEGIAHYVNELKDIKKTGEKITSIVMNCNPFTLGHKYLIEKAASENDVVHIFVVSENRSQFSSEDRYKLVKEGTKDLPNVFVHEGGKYIISAATFPSYFLKESSNIVSTHAELDLAIFSKYIAPVLGITSRYVGEEKTCLVTHEYNSIMKKMLPKFDIEVIEVPRLEVEGTAISASRVRALLKEKNGGKIKEIVPPTTYEYLMKRLSEE